MLPSWCQRMLLASSLVSSTWAQCQQTAQLETATFQFIEQQVAGSILPTKSVYINGYYAYNTTIKVDEYNSLVIDTAPCTINTWVTLACACKGTTPTTQTYYPAATSTSGTLSTVGMFSISGTIGADSRLSSSAHFTSSILGPVSSLATSTLRGATTTSSRPSVSTTTTSTTSSITPLSPLIAPNTSSGGLTTIDQQFFLTVTLEGGLQKRDGAAQNFLMYDGTLGNNSQAAYFSLIDGALYGNGLQISSALNPTGILFAGSDVIGDISTTFSLLNNTLTWNNETFSTGQAFFGLDSFGLVRASSIGPVPSSWQKVVLSAYGVPGSNWNETYGSSSNYTVTPKGYTQGLTLVESSGSTGNSSSNRSLTATTPSYDFPPGLENFGGVDIRQRQGYGINPGLWNFTSPFSTRTVDFTPVTAPSGATKRSGLHRRVKTTYKIPIFLSFDSISTFDKAEISSETRESYQSILGTTFGVSGGAFGFSAEFQDSFKTTSNSETYKKYAGSYTIAKMYGAKLTSSNAMGLRKFLSDEAIALFNTGTADDIIERFGTHYMSSASFGGWKRTTHELDIRDNSVSTAHSTALQIKVAIKDPEIGNPEFGTNYSTQDETTRKIATTLSTSYTTCLGGTAYLCDIETNSLQWLSSLPGNAGIAGHTLVTLDNLIIDSLDGQGKKAAVAALIATILAAQEVNRSKALVIYKPMTHISDDAGSRAHDSISCARVNADDGWYSLGHYAQGPNPTGSFRNNPSQFLGIQIQEAPQIQATAKSSLIQKPIALYRTWGMRSRGGFGSFEMIGPKGFAALSGIFLRKDSAGLDDFGSAAMIHTSLLKPATAYNQIWRDSGSGARDDGSIWRITGPDDGSITPMSLTPTNTLPAYLFCSTSGYGAPNVPKYQLDFSQITVVSNSFLAGIQLPKNA